MSDPLREQLLALAGELHPEDGVDPELLRRRERSGKRVKQRKLLALCREVQRTLQLSVPADIALDVVSVTPDADPARLIVLLLPTDPLADRATLTQRIDGLRGTLRTEVARSLHRRRVPDLVYRLGVLPS